MALETKITEDELDLYETLAYPIAASEILFSNLESPNFTEFNEKFSSIRLYQYLFMSFEYLLDYDVSKTPKENFRLREHCGTIYGLAARLIGKTLVVEQIDLLLSMLYLDNEKAGFTSFDLQHIRSILEEVILALEQHPIFKLLDAKITRHPSYNIKLKTGYNLDGLNQNLQSKSPGCFDDKTEILTNMGWKYFSDLKESDKVLSCDYNSNFKADFYSIKRIISYDYDGVLKVLKSRTSEFRVTPDHKLLMSSSSGKVGLKEVSDTSLPKQIYCNSTFTWAGTNPKNITLERYCDRSPSVTISTDIWVRFVAWYLAEGSLDMTERKTVSIFQKNNCKELEDCLNALGLPYKKVEREPQSYVYQVHNSTIARHLAKHFGSRKTKHIASYFKEYSSVLLNSFIDEYLLGDGNAYLQNGRYEAKSIYCSVKSLIDDLQEVAQKAGYKSHLRTLVRDVTIGKYKYKNNVQHKLFLCRSKNTTFQKSKIVDLPYKGKVWCVEVEPFHTIFVRRNGAVLWTGQSSFHQKHLTRLYIEEASYEDEEINKKRIESVSEYGCVAEDSLVVMADLTTKKIQNVLVGDEIIGWNQKNNTIEKAKVTHVLDKGIKDVVQVSDGKNSLWLTPDHRMRVFSKGSRNYHWGEAIRCSLTEYYTQSLNYINDYEVYLKGVLLGLIDSDGHVDRKLGSKQQQLEQFRIYQSEACEVDLIRWLLNKLNITFTERVYDNNRAFWADGSVRTPQHLFHIRTENNSKIHEFYDELTGKVNNDICFGYIAGFVIGDGYVGHTGALIINQSITNVKKADFVESILKKINVEYRRRNEPSKTSGEIVTIVIHKYKIPFAIPQSKKCQRYLSRILGVRRFIWNRQPRRLKLSGHKSSVHVYDLSTTLENFIANGFIVHNCVIRAGGMTNFTRHSPIGRIFYDFENRKHIVNMPSFANPTWDDRKKKKAIEKHNGEHTTSYRIYILGEVVEEGLSVIDMSRVRPFYLEDKFIKHFEITKENFERFESIIVVDRMRNSGRCWVGVDVGESAPTEIAVLFEIEQTGQPSKYRYVYNITAYNLTDKQQFRLLAWLMQQLLVTYISIDVSDGTGRAIYRSLEEVFGSKNLVWVSFQEKLEVGFEKDEQNNIVIKDGKPVIAEEYVAEFSIQRLKTLLYEHRFETPPDHKLDTQLNSLVSTKSGSRIIYGTVNEEDHLLAAIRTFTIAQWKEEFSNTKPVNSKKFCKTGVST